MIDMIKIYEYLPSSCTCKYINLSEIFRDMGDIHISRDKNGKLYRIEITRYIPILCTDKIVALYDENKNLLGIKISMDRTQFSWEDIKNDFSIIPYAKLEQEMDSVSANLISAGGRDRMIPVDLRIRTKDNAPKKGEKIEATHPLRTFYIINRCTETIHTYPSKYWHLPPTHPAYFCY